MNQQPLPMNQQPLPMNQQPTPHLTPTDILESEEDALLPTDHRLVLALADEMVRMELNLKHMDPEAKGHRQLIRSLERMRNHLLSAGYEVVEMLGKPYEEGMKVVANFVLDETLPEGAQIITGITRPQVNYQGQMIQVAQITVSQN